MNIPEFGVAHNLTIASITKSFPGQAGKVMNALWGAGQMMFNKFMVVLDDKEIIDNYYEIIKKFSELDFSQRLVFAKGPLDVLDHSAQKMGYGSKLGIDLSTPLPEELQTYPRVSEFIAEKTVRHSDSVLGSEYTAVRFPGTRILILNIKKGAKEGIMQGLPQILEGTKPLWPRVIVLLDENVDITDYYLVCWVALNNTDPLRDISLVPFSNDQVLLMDATSKDYNEDRFSRSWPNVIVMDETTISSIDKNWEKLIPFRFIESPSRKFKKLVNNQGAVANL